MMKDEITRVLHHERIRDEDTSPNPHLLCVACEDEFSKHCLTALPPSDYHITVVNDQDQAVSILGRTVVDLVIIGNPMKLEDRAALIFSMKRESPETLVLLLLARGEPLDPLADFVVTCAEDAEYLCQTIRDLLGTYEPRRIL